MEKLKTFFEFSIAGFKIGITSSIITEWVIMAILIIAALILARRLETVPKGKQVFTEVIVDTINGLVRGNMGEKYMNFAPYFGSLVMFILLMNFTGLVGVKPPTTDVSVTLGLAIISFFLINVTSIRRNGAGHYLKSFVHPYSFMLPLNIIDKFTVPVSLCLRLFGNMFAATIMMDLLYKALAYFSQLIFLNIHIAENFNLSFLQLVLPIPFHLYFDLFDGSIQMFIFIMLTMIFIKTTSEE